MQPKFSIIIPVYNTEQFLSECLDSCIDQTYKNIEIIIVNDGSPDESEKIIMDYQSKDARIKYIKQKNSGVFAAYRNGFNQATGEYIIHCDSDDWLNIEYIEQVVKNLDPKIDTYMMNTISVFNNGYTEKSRWVNKGLRDYNNQEWFDALCKRTKTSWALWGVTLKQELLKQVYDTIEVSNTIVPSYDCLVTVAYSLFSKKVKFIPIDGFYYRINPNGVSFSTVTIEKLTRTLESESQVFNSLYKLLTQQGINISNLDKIRHELGYNFIHHFHQLGEYSVLYDKFQDRVYEIYGLSIKHPKKRYIFKKILQIHLIRIILMKIYRFFKR